MNEIGYPEIKSDREPQFKSVLMRCSASGQSQTWNFSFIARLDTRSVAKLAKASDMQHAFSTEHRLARSSVAENLVHEV